MEPSVYLPKFFGWYAAHNQNPGPLVLVVDDDPAQLKTAYLLARQHEIPRENILLFQDAREAIEFLAFAKEFKLKITGIMTDYDNSGYIHQNSWFQASSAGNYVLEASLGYHKATSHTPPIRLLVSSEHRDFSEGIVSEIKNENGTIENGQGTWNLKYEEGEISFYRKDMFEHINGFFKQVSKRMISAGIPPEPQKLGPALVMRLGILDHLSHEYTHTIQNVIEQSNVSDREKSRLHTYYGQPFRTIHQVKDEIQEMMKIIMLVRYNLQETPEMGEEHSPLNDPFPFRLLLEFCDLKLHELLKTLNEDRKQFDHRYTNIRSLIFPDGYDGPDKDQRAYRASWTAHSLAAMANAVVLNVLSCLETIEARYNSELLAPERRSRTQFGYDAMFSLVNNNYSHQAFAYIEPEIPDKENVPPPGVMPPVRMWFLPQNMPIKGLGTVTDVPPEQCVSPIKLRTLEEFRELIARDMIVYGKNKSASAITYLQEMRRAAQANSAER